MRVGSSLIANLNAGCDSDAWSLYLFARNLFDEDYLTQRNAPGGFGGSRQVRTGEPRVAGAELTLRFGL